MKFARDSLSRFIFMLPVLAIILFAPQLTAVKDDKSIDRSARMGGILLDAHKKGERIPVLSVQFPGLDEKAAYGVQRYYVKHRLTDDQIAGFKAGLTSTASMKRFGVNEPVVGILFKSGRSSNPAVIDTNSQTIFMPMLETEIGYIAEKQISQPLPDVTALKRHIRYLVPVIEIPELGFTEMPKLKGPDIIAANAGSRYFIVGTTQKLQDIEPDTVSVTLKDHSGTVLNQAKGNSVINGQWHALLWMVNRIVKQGWTIKPGHLLITGALGKMIPAKPGKYSALYGQLGRIDFEIK